MAAPVAPGVGTGPEPQRGGLWAGVEQSTQLGSWGRGPKGTESRPGPPELESWLCCVTWSELLTFRSPRFSSDKVVPQRFRVRAN